MQVWGIPHYFFLLALWFAAFINYTDACCLRLQHKLFYIFWRLVSRTNIDSKSLGVEAAIIMFATLCESHMESALQGKLSKILIVIKN